MVRRDEQQKRWPGFEPMSRLTCDSNDTRAPLRVVLASGCAQQTRIAVKMAERVYCPTRSSLSRHFDGPRSSCVLLSLRPILPIMPRLILSFLVTAVAAL